MLDLVAAHRFLTARHIQVFCFVEHATDASAARTCRRVLARLERWRLLERPIRRIGGLQAGSASSIWMLTSTGQRLRSIRAGRGAVGRVRPPGERFIAHYLAVADAHLALVQAEQVGQLAISEVRLEPACWRQFAGLGGGRRVLKPDLAAVTAPTGDTEYEDHWFVEVDRGTESLPTLIRQCRLYEDYRRSGSHQAVHGVFPLVIWVVPDATRAAKLTAAIAAARGIATAGYRVTTPDGFIALVVGGGT